ncbi:MAG TPA: hypothetical protein VEX64_04360 [Pyrinomonadaceae bacterium]|nr:hypothetical protein [Pyrinomonadaceae bacterium]
MNNFNPAAWFKTEVSPSEGRRRWQEEQKRKNTIRVFLLGLLCLTVVAAGATVLMRQRAEAIPLEFAGKVINVRKGGNFQAALNQAKGGDTIVLEAGAEFVGSFELPNKEGADFITIKSSKAAELPENTRVTAEQAALMPKIISPGRGQSAIYTSPKAHHYRFIGIEISSKGDYVYNMVELGKDDYKTLDDFPHHFEFDRVFVHAAGLNKARRGFALNGAEIVIKNSRIAGFAGEQDETQAIASWNGIGKFKIINNHLEGGAENILIGGNDPSVKDLVPSDIEIRRNLITKPLEWRGKATLKNLLELKNARRVQITGNILENCSECDAMWITVRNQNGTAQWSTIEDIEIRNNLIRGASSGINFLGTDDNYKSQRMKRVKVVNNLLEEIDSVKWGNSSGGGYFVQLSGTEDVEIAHNTVFNDGNMITAHNEPNARFVFRYNILPHNEYGLFGSESGVSLNMLARHFPGGAFVNNIIINNRGIPANALIVPPRNFALQTFPDVGFTNWRNRDYSLKDGSRFKGKTENGKDYGCDFKELNAAIAGVETSAR